MNSCEDTMPGATSEEDSEWLKGVVNTFKEMSVCNKMKTFRALLEQSSPEERYSLVELVTRHLRCDIFISLPTELQEHVCHYIDVQSLLVACSVCKEWNAVISSLSEVWCRKHKIIMRCTKRASKMSKTDCIEGLKLRHGLKTGSTFVHNNVSATLLSLEQITGLSYCDDFLIGSADRQVGIWGVPSFELASVFQAPFRVSCLQLRGRLLALGHSTGSLTTWALEGEGAALRHELRSHTGVVMAVSVHPRMDLVASGACDCCAKLWALSSGRLLRTLTTGHSHWVLQVTLLSPRDNEQFDAQRTDAAHEAPFDGQHALVTVTRDHIQVFAWSAHADPSAIQGAAVELPLNAVDRLFTPGCHVVGERVVHVQQSLSEGEDAEIVFRSLRTKAVERRVRVAGRVRKLLAVGEAHALVLLPRGHSANFNLVVVELSAGEVVGGCLLPHSSSSTPDLSQIALGDAAWLHDLSLLRPGALVVALGLPSQMRVVTWRGRDADSKAEREAATGDSSCAR